MMVLLDVQYKSLFNDMSIIILNDEEVELRPIEKVIDVIII